MDKIYRLLQSAAEKLNYNLELRPLKPGHFPDYVESDFITLLGKYLGSTETRQWCRGVPYIKPIAQPLT
jgi:hypothetical protein